MKQLFRNAWILIVLPLVFAGCSGDDDGVDPREQFEYETEVIDNYIAQNGIFALIDPNTQLRYDLGQQGSGLSPYVVDSVTISYRVSILETGEVVDEGISEKVVWNTLILGARLGLSKIEEGGTVRVFVPSIYGYGEAGTDNIPPNTTLIVELFLEEVHARQLREEIAIIEQYLDDNGLEATFDPHGFYYTIINPGVGTTPLVLSTVSVNYEGKVLETDQRFDAGESVSFTLAQVIPGWQIGVPLIKDEGGKIILYLPSPLGYGAQGSPPLIPEYAQLIFEVELLEVF
jgi:FKBP-type peptidyl-prolyl cis-trans isomerase